MRYKITEEQLKKIHEYYDSERVICKCGWSWSLSDGGNDPFICHKCGRNNEE
jgi:tRNA(Ile2) C34 agmatinyltransferase TiaS